MIVFRNFHSLVIITKNGKGKEKRAAHSTSGMARQNLKKDDCYEPIGFGEY